MAGLVETGYWCEFCGTVCDTGKPGVPVAYLLLVRALRDMNAAYVGPADADVRLAAWERSREILKLCGDGK